MNKKIICLCIFFVFCCAYQAVFALETGTIYVESDRDIVEKGEDIEITINLKETKTAAFDLSLYFDNTKWEYISKIENTNVEKDRILLVWHDTEGGKSSIKGELAKFKFRAKENGISTFNVLGEFYNESGQLIDMNFEEKQIQIGKEENLIRKQSEEQGDNSQTGNSYLQALRLDIEGITPDFDKNIEKYYITVPNNINKIEVTAVSENPKANVKITGNTTMNEGLNTIKILVTSEDKKESRTYTIEVTKTADLEAANTKLETLAIENTLLNPPFDVDVTHYEIDIGNEINDLNILAIPQNEKAKVQINGNNNLKEGNNLITIVVTAPNGITKKTYEIQAYKRNTQEETKYKEEQEKMQEKLENAYKIEKVNGYAQEESPENINKESKGNGWVIAIGVIIIATIAIVIFYYIRNKRK